MPTYVYQCSDCSNSFEIEQRISEDPLKTCPCGSEGTVKRVIQPVGVMFKGSGFYVTDYANSGSKSASAEAPSCSGEPKSCPSCKPEA